MNKRLSDDSEKRIIQANIDSVMLELNRASDSIFDNYIIQSEEVQNAVRSAQKELGVERSTIPKNKEISWIKTNSAVLKKWFASTRLPDSWYTFFVQYVISAYVPPSTDLVHRESYIEIQDTDDHSVTLRIKKGVRFEEYTYAWKALSPFLGAGRRKNKLPDYDTRIRDLQMYGKHQSGYTNKMIADDYVNAINDDNAKDTVKKAVRRQKKLFEKGTDLAK